MFERPGIFPEPVKCADNALLDGERGFPAGRADFFRVEKNEWVSTDPTAFSTRIFETRLEVHRVANPTDGIFDFAIFIRAEVVSFDAVARPLSRGLLDDPQHRREAIADVQIRFALGAVAENF